MGDKWGPWGLAPPPRTGGGRFVGPTAGDPGESRRKSGAAESIETSRALFARRVRTLGGSLSRAGKEGEGKWIGAGVPRSLNAAVLEYQSNDMLKGRGRGRRDPRRLSAIARPRAR